jgi:large subunit ribosomal protein L23
MAIFSRKTQSEKQEQVPAAAVPVAQPVVPGSMLLLLPRLSEKAGSLARLHKYVFKVTGSANKIEVRKAVEKLYGVKVASVNMIAVQGKVRRYGRSSGKMSNFKKAVVTLTKDSKPLTQAEPL